MQKISKLWKAALLTAAGFALALSVSTAFALPPSPGGGGGENNYWVVTCNYDGQEILVSKSCTSGGSHSCNCG